MQLHHPAVSELGLNLTRRRFFERGSHLLGGISLATLMAESAARGDSGGAAVVGSDGVARMPGAIGPHFAPKAKHVI